jgi:hypothetical protein
VTVDAISRLEQTIKKGLEGRGVSRWVDDYTELHDAVQRKELGLLTAFSKIVEHRSIRLRNTRRFYEILVHQGYTDAEKLLSFESMTNYLRISDFIGWVDPALPKWDEVSYYPLICLFVAADAQNRERVEDVIIGRQIIDVVQVRELLSDMRNNAGVLVGGVL